jgi:hypothetical protein
MHQTLQNRTGISVVLKGPPQWVDASNVAHFPSEVRVIRPNGKFSTVPAGTTTPINIANGSGTIFIAWADNAPATSIATLGKTATGGEGAGYQVTAQSANWEAIGSFSADTPALLSLNANHSSLSAATWDVVQGNGDGTGNFHAGKARTGTLLPLTNHDQTLQNRNGINVMMRGQPPYVDQNGVLHFPADCMIIRPNGNRVAVVAGTTVPLTGALSNGSGTVFAQWVDNGNAPSVVAIGRSATGPEGTGYQATATSTNYEAIGSFSNVAPYNFALYLANNASLASATYDIVQPNSDGTGTYHAGKARTGTLLPLTNHDQTVQNRNGISFTLSGQMPYVNASNVLYFPSYLHVHRPDGSYCFFGPGTSVQLSTTYNQTVFMQWVANSGAASIVAISNPTTGAAGVGYAATMSSPNWEPIGTSSAASSPVVFSPYFTNSNTVAAASDVVGDNRDGTGNFHAGKARTGTLLPLGNHHATVQNRTGLHVSVAGKMPYIDGSNVLHFPSTVIFFRPNGDWCRITAGSTVSGLTWGSIFINWASSGYVTPVFVYYANGSTTPGLGYQATFGSPNYELVGGINCDISPYTFSPAFDNSNTAAASADVIGDNLDGTGNFHAGKARGGTLLPLPSHDPDVQKVQQRNLLKNGNFTLGDGLAYGWTMYSGGVSTMLNGSYGSYGSQYVDGPSGSGIYQTIRVKPGVSYSYACMLDNDVGTRPGSTCRVFIGSTNWMTQYNSGLPAPSGTTGAMWTSNSSGRASSESQNAGNVWNSVSGTFTVPAGVTQVNFLLQGFNGSGNYRFYANFAAMWEGSKWQDYVDGDPLPGALHYSHTPGAVASVIGSAGDLDVSKARGGTQLPHGSNSASVQTVLNQNGDIIGPVDVPQLTHMSSGTFRGMYRLDMAPPGYSFASANGALGTNQWHTFECSMNGDASVGWGPILFDQNGNGILVDCISGTTLALHTHISGTWNRVQDYAFNAQDGRWHRFTLKLVWTGSVVRIVCFIDGTKSHDYSTSAFNAGGLYQPSPGFYNDAAGHAYVRPKWQFVHNGESPLLSSTPLNSQGSLSYISNPSVTASGSGQSCTINVSGSIVYPDGTTTSVSANLYPPNNGALAYQTVYSFSVRFNLSTNQPEIGDWQAGALSAAQVEKCYYDGFIPISTTSTYTTPSSSGGTGTGSGGGGKTNQCPAVGQPLETLERGVVPAGEVQQGMHVVGKDGQWTCVYAAYDGEAELVRVTVEDEDYDVEWNHLWLMPDGEWIESCRLGLGTLVAASDGSAKRVRKIESLGPGTYRKLRVRGGVFRMGAVIAHNIITY